tara:strand:+ start:292 stop:552 length:261 start_codon:yes stop_codon:yes gene_type:complete
MLENQTLWKRLKPEIKSALMSNESRYKFSVDRVIVSLKVNEFYSGLTMSQIDSLLVFGDVETYEWSAFDLKYDFKMFVKRNEVNPK